MLTLIKFLESIVGGLMSDITSHFFFCTSLYRDDPFAGKTHTANTCPVKDLVHQPSILSYSVFGSFLFSCLCVLFMCPMRVHHVLCVCFPVCVSRPLCRSGLSVFHFPLCRSPCLSHVFVFCLYLFPCSPPYVFCLCSLVWTLVLLSSCQVPTS